MATTLLRVNVVLAQPPAGGRPPGLVNVTAPRIVPAPALAACACAGSASGTSASNGNRRLQRRTMAFDIPDPPSSPVESRRAGREIYSNRPITDVWECRAYVPPKSLAVSAIRQGRK